MSYQDNGEKTAHEMHESSRRFNVRDLENWIEKAERILARIDKYQRTGEMPEKGTATTGDNQGSPVRPGRT